MATANGNHAVSPYHSSPSSSSRVPRQNDVGPLHGEPFFARDRRTEGIGSTTGKRPVDGPPGGRVRVAGERRAGAVIRRAVRGQEATPGSGPHAGAGGRARRGRRAPARSRGTVKNSRATRSRTWSVKNARRLGSGVVCRVGRRGEPVRSATVIPSFDPSPWIRGAPPSGWAAAMRGPRAWISAWTAGGPRSAGRRAWSRPGRSAAAATAPRWRAPRARGPPLIPPDPGQPDPPEALCPGAASAAGRFSCPRRAGGVRRGTPGRAGGARSRGTGRGEASGAAC